MTITADDPVYPVEIRELLSSKTIHAVGSTGLLGRSAIGVCGSRDASERALRWAYEFGAEAAKRDLVVVSGYARGVDRMAHLGAIEAGGATIAVLPTGIRQFRMLKELRAHADLESNFLAVSMFDPDATWEAWRAMERNRLIVGLSTAVFVIEARDRGGTISAAHECVRQGKKLYAIAYKTPSTEDEGNQKLIADSAIPLAHLGDLHRALQTAMLEPPAKIQQLVLALVSPTGEIVRKGK